MFVTGAIDALEDRIMGYINVLVALLHTLTDGKIVMLLTGKLCELMVKVELKIYRNFVTHNKRENR